MVALAADTDVVARLGRDLSEPETASVPGLLAEASTLVAGYCGRDWSELADVPEAVRIVVSRMTARALTGSSNLPAGTTEFGSSLSVMSHNVKLGADVVIGSVWLSRVDKITLGPHVWRSVVNMPMY
ncbi:hypothetical protein MN2019_17875 [Mycolicibacterium neoaurum]|uniref:hypothetical protein n=1 Tax=Mycolicibacterium neoaurum TaxID=1795 RepID=UPI001BCD7D18|nr:hypothetical protein [Mycolicibacterium neoaurum]QVI26171.1 hypothetical protein MN2019_17875 [Mycolicibacterium neoaurum]